MSWIDVHVHLDKLATSVDETLALAAASGVDRVITIGTDPNDHPVVLALSQKYPKKVFCTLGIHPHDSTHWDSSVLNFIKDNYQEPGVVAVGEIGLDYYYNQSPKDVQIKAFEEQLELASKIGLPVEIHTRDAEDDTLAILKNFEGRVNGLIHCFTGTQKLADGALALGYNISISGVVTFKNAEDLRNVVRSIPLDRIHVETDAPFLAPVPKRGKENTSAYMIHTAEVVAGLKNISMEELKALTTANAQNLFKKIN